jgi:hypothetical protein
VSTPAERGDAWPVPERPPDRSPLPRLDDIPQADHGYDPDQVREAFDSFYRHIAQMDTTLRTLEAVDTFRHQAGTLRQELRALRAAGWTQQPLGSGGGYGGSARRSGPGLPDALPRLALEAGFLVLVAVLVGVLHFGKVAVILTMLLAWTVVGVVEWLAARDRYTPPRPVSAPPAPEARPAPAVAPAAALPAPSTPAPQADAAGWAAYSEPAPAEPEALTFVAEAEEAQAAEEPEPPPAAEPEAQVEPAEPEPAEPEVAEPEAVVEPEPESVPEPQPEEPPQWSWGEDQARGELAGPEPESRPRRWLRLRHRETDDEQLEPEQPRHVRVLKSGEEPESSLSPDDIDRILDPWEEELDVDGLPDADREAARDPRS